MRILFIKPRKKGGIPMILLIVIFFALQAFVLFCCLAAGNDPLSQRISDEEQMEYLASWKQAHQK